MLDSQALNHVLQIPVFGVQLPNFCVVLLVPGYADGVTARDLVFVSFEVFGYFFRRVLVQVADGALVWVLLCVCCARYDRAVPMKLRGNRVRNLSGRVAVTHLRKRTFQVAWRAIWVCEVMLKARVTECLSCLCLFLLSILPGDQVLF